MPPAPQWETFFTGDTLAGIRAGLEISRVWPGVGAWTGLASDVAGTVSDIATINQEDAPILKTVIAIRGILNAVNNFVGHIGYVQELGSKVAAVSVIGAWLTPILDSIGMALKDLKLLLDLALGLIDVGIWAAAEQQKLHATTPESAGRWNNLIGGYQANMIGDLATLLVDGWDAATATEGDGEVAKQAVYSMKGLMQAARKFGPILLNWIMGLFNVYGSKVTTPTMPAQATPDAGGGGSTPPTLPRPPGAPRRRRRPFPPRPRRRPASRACSRPRWRASGRAWERARSPRAARRCRWPSSPSCSRPSSATWRPTRPCPPAARPSRRSCSSSGSR